MSKTPEDFLRLTPVRKGWRLLCLCARPSLVRKVATLVTEGYFAQTGWVRSVCENEIVDARGEPVPWAALPYIDFIKPRLQSDWVVFEYGAGASTLFYARHVKSVMAVEHDAEFAAQMNSKLPPNAKIVVHPLGSEEYVQALRQCPVPLHIVSVDGRDRVSCMKAAMASLDNKGVIILDDAERAEYAPGREALLLAGFREIEFWGMAPGRPERKCTSVFYKSGNVLGL